MRAALCMVLALSACSATGRVSSTSGEPDAGSGTTDPSLPPPDLDGGTINDAGSPTDAGSSADAGSPSDGGSAADGGMSADAGVPPDGGPVAQLETVECPEAPHLLWSRTFSDEAVFSGTTDASGNLYWLEFDPPRSEQNPDPPSFLVSADPAGKDRYRVPAPFPGLLAVAGRIVGAKGTVVAGYDAATGAISWTADLSASYPAGAAVQGLVDVGAGRFAFVVNSDQRSGIYFANASNGAILAFNESVTDRNRMLLGSDRAGSVLALANGGRDSISQPPDVFLLDATGTERWRERLSGGPPSPGRFLGWPPALPWISVAGASGISSNGNHWTTPGDLFAAAFTGDIGIAFDTTTVISTPTGSRFPVGIDVLRDHRIAARTLLDGLDTFNGIVALPLANGDHVDFVAEDDHHVAGLCHVVEPGTAIFGRADAASTFQCPLPLLRDTFVGAVAISAGHLVVGGTILTTTACSMTEFDPFTIQVYSLPGGPP